MGVTSVNVDSVPAGSFTPQEPLVELLRVCLEKNCSPFLSEASEKPFLVTWLIKEWSKKCHSQKKSKVLLLVPTEQKASLWQNFIKSLTCVPVKKINEEFHENFALVIATPEELLECSQTLKDGQLKLAILDNR